MPKLKSLSRPTVFFLGAAVAVATLALAPKPMSDDETAVRAVAQLYIDGAATVEAEYFNKAFAVPGADMKYVRTDRETGETSLRRVPIEDAIKGWTSRPAEKSWGKVLNVDIIDGKLAHATVEILWGGTIYVDVMAMYKIGDEWKIVNKTFVNRGPAPEGSN